MKPLRILVLTHEYPPVGGGGGKVAQDECEALARRGHTIDLLTSSHPSLTPDRSLPNLRVLRLKCGRKELYRASFSSMLRFVLAASVAAWRLNRQKRYDVIQTHFAVPAGAAAWLTAKLTGLPYVITAHLGDVPGGTPEKTDAWFRGVYPFSQLIWRDAAQVTAVSEFTRGLAAPHYPVPIRVIPNGICLDDFGAINLEPHHPPLIVFSARFMAQKNPLQVVRSLALVRDLPWQAALLGDGPLQAQICAEITRLGLSERFNLPGWLPAAQVQAWMARADIFMLPSYSEGLPVSGLLAKAHGLALLLGCCGGNAELVRSPAEGYLIEPDDTLAFAAALRYLLTDPAALRAMRQASLESAAFYDLDRMVDDYEKVLYKAANR